MPISNRSVFLHWSTSNGVTSRTAVYGPVRTVVWQGATGNRRPYADHITVPRTARLRRVRPKWVEIHHADLQTADVTVQEGLPITTVSRTVDDILASTGQVGMVRQAISDARREGYIDSAEAQRLKRRINKYIHTLEADTQPLVRENR